MYNVVPGISQQPTTIIWYSDSEKFSYNSYLAISVFILLSYMVVLDAQLGEHYNFFPVEVLCHHTNPCAH